MTSKPACGDCRHFFSSERANHKSVLAGFGYCHATNDARQRSLFFRGDVTLCWHEPARFAAIGSLAPSPATRERGAITLAGLFWLAYLAAIASVLLRGLPR